MKKQNFKKYIGEGLLIVFSVLFALFINKTYEDSKTNRYKKNAISQIKAELLDNQKILEEWITDHRAILINLNNLINDKNDSIQVLAKEKEYLPIQIILDNKSLINKPLSNSAWSSAQSIGIISEFDFKTLQYINTTYELQDLIMNTTIDNIAERIFLRSNDYDNIKGVTIELSLRFQNLLGQEQSLNSLFTETIQKLN